MTSTINKSQHIIGCRCLNKLNKFAKTHKDREPRSFNNNVIYKIFCKNCDATYVGKTKKQLKIRLKEHKNNIRPDHSKHSVVSEHIINFNHNFDWENVQIFDHEHNYHKRMISKMIHIKEQNKGLNCMNTDLLDDCYSEHTFQTLIFTILLITVQVFEIASQILTITVTLQQLNRLVKL